MIAGNTGKKGGDLLAQTHYGGTLDILDFAPLLNANYSWRDYHYRLISTEDVNSNEFFKITVKFLSNEIRPMVSIFHYIKKIVTTTMFVKFLKLKVL